jgi:hypothetical protein
LANRKSIWAVTPEEGKSTAGNGVVDHADDGAKDGMQTLVATHHGHTTCLPIDLLARWSIYRSILALPRRPVLYCPRSGTMRCPTCYRCSAMPPSSSHRPTILLNPRTSPAPPLLAQRAFSLSLTHPSSAPRCTFSRLSHNLSSLSLMPLDVLSLAPHNLLRLFCPIGLVLLDYLTGTRQTLAPCAYSTPQRKTPYDFSSAI